MAKHPLPLGMVLPADNTPLSTLGVVVLGGPNRPVQATFQKDLEADVSHMTSEDFARFVAESAGMALGPVTPHSLSYTFSGIYRVPSNEPYVLVKGQDGLFLMSLIQWERSGGPDRHVQSIIGEPLLGVEGLLLDSEGHVDLRAIIRLVREERAQGYRRSSMYMGFLDDHNVVISGPGMSELRRHIRRCQSCQRLVWYVRNRNDEYEKRRLGDAQVFNVYVRAVAYRYKNPNRGWSEPF
jgi:hypothetical protein